MAASVKITMLWGVTSFGIGDQHSRVSHFLCMLRAATDKVEAAGLPK